MVIDAQNTDAQPLCEAPICVPHIAPAEFYATSASTTQVGALPTILQLVNRASGGEVPCWRPHSPYHVTEEELKHWAICQGPRMSLWD